MQKKLVKVKVVLMWFNGSVVQRFVRIPEGLQGRVLVGCKQLGARWQLYTLGEQVARIILVAG